MPLFAIARLTIREAVRRRLVQAVAILSVIVIGLTAWGFAYLHASMSKNPAVTPALASVSYAMLVIVLARMFSFVVAVGAAMLGALSIAGDVDSGVALVMLPRPIRRSDFVLGKWSGWALLLAAFVAGAGGLELAAVRLVTGYAPPHPVVALAFIAAEGIALLSLSVALSTRLASITAGVIALVLFGVAAVAEVGLTVAAFLHNAGLAHACAVVSLLVPTGGLWRGAAFALEPALIAAISGTPGGANPITVAAGPTNAYLVWTCFWLAGALAGSIWSFNRRDI